MERHGKTFWSFVSRGIASLGGIGYVPCAPGTVGSIAALLILAWIGSGLAIALFAGLALLAIPQAERSFGTHDARQIVIDEAAGISIALWRIPPTLPLLAIGLLMFRLLDIFKPLALKRLERLRSPWGVLLDDVGAGLLTNLILQGWIRWVR